MRLVMNCPALRQDTGPFEDLSVLRKFVLVQQVVRSCLTKCIMHATRNNQKTTAPLFSRIVGQVPTSSRSQKTYSHLFSVTSDTQVMKSTNCYRICPLVRISPKTISMCDS